MKEKIAAFSRKYVDEFIPNYLSSAILPSFYFCSLVALAYTIWGQSFGRIIFSGGLLIVVGLLSVPVIVIGIPMSFVRDATNPPRPVPAITKKHVAQSAYESFQGVLFLAAVGIIALILALVCFALWFRFSGNYLGENQFFALYFFFLFGTLAVIATHSYVKPQTPVNKS